jgi:hypothetical protein
MNIRKIKLALTVGLLNVGPSTNVLQIVKDLLADIQDLGTYLGQKQLNQTKISPISTKETVALQYEHGTIALDVIRHRAHPHQLVQQFRLMP